MGKTFVAALFTEALHADYWKPVQCGSIDNTDSHFVQLHISNTKTAIHKEAFLLKAPMSPHAAAELENINITLDQITLPETANTLVIEGAGGLMVPLNSANLVVDLISEFKAEVVLVVKHYLGSINHTLLSIDALKNRNIPIAGIVFNGERNEASEKVILQHYLFPFVAYTDYEPEFSKETVRKYSKKFSTI